MLKLKEKSRPNYCGRDKMVARWLRGLKNLPMKWRLSRVGVGILLTVDPSTFPGRPRIESETWRMALLIDLKQVDGKWLDH